MQSRLGFVPSQITLGAVQFGMAYGLGNASGPPSEAQVHDTLDAALAAGITTIDTGRAYGSSESRIGSWLSSRRCDSVHIITKVPRLPMGSDEERRRVLTAELNASRRALRVERLGLVLAHDEKDLLDGNVVDAFRSAVETGEIDGFGASVYSTEIALRIIETAPIAALQVPANILDRRFEKAGIFAKASALGIAVFARSVFLKGALIGKPELLPIHLAPLAEVVAQVQRIARDAGRSLPEFLIPPIRDIPGVVSLVIGVDRADQLLPHLAALRAQSPATLLMQWVDAAAERLPREMIDPPSWRLLEMQAQTRTGV